MASQETMNFEIEKIKKEKIKNIINEVYNSLKENGYNPVNQLVGYILSGDPTYITNKNDARKKIVSIERDEILEELLKEYLEKK